MSRSGDILIRELADQQVLSYRAQPANLVGDGNHERNTVNAYRGRQILELLQNADDAGKDYRGDSQIHFAFAPDSLIVANTGRAFTEKGIRSLVVSDNSPKRLTGELQIGNKGLGFRSVLSWSRSPLVMSGEFTVAFSAEHARARVAQLAIEVPGLAEEEAQFGHAGVQLPVPVLRFPYIPTVDDPRARQASDFIERGFDTVIVLPFDRDREGAQNEAELQLDEFASETLLFCNHLRRVEIAGRKSRYWQVARSLGQGSEQVDVISSAATSVWRIHRAAGSLPDEVIDEEVQDTRRFEVAVAVPDRPVAGRDHRLCVYFPTDVAVPCALIGHATLLTDDSRKHLVDHPANEYVLRQLASVMIAAAAEAARSAPLAGLQLLSGLEDSDSELEDLGFLDAVVEAARATPLFPRLDGQLGNAGEVMEAPHAVWEQIASAESFPEMLLADVGETARALLDLIDVPVYAWADLRPRIENHMAGMAPADAGEVLGRLIRSRALPKTDPPRVLVADGHADPIEASRTAFLPAAEPQVPLPSWVSNFAVLDRDFAAGLRSGLAVATAREVRQHLADAGFAVEEYQLEGVGRLLVREAAEAAGNEAVPPDLIRDILRVLYAMARSADSDGPIRIGGLQVPTIGGSVRRAADCYLGPAYPNGRLVFELYSGLGVDEFAAAPSELGLDASSRDAETFLRRLGVAASPRYVAVKQAPSGFAEAILNRLEYPNRVFGTEVADARTAAGLLRWIQFEGLSMPERFEQVLATSPSEAIIAWVIAEGRRHLSAGQRSSAILHAIQGQQYKTRPYAAVEVPDLVDYLLRSTPWVTCTDGERHPPRRVFISRVGQRALASTFKTPALDPSHPVLAEIGMAHPAEYVLESLGAVRTFDEIGPDELYAMLMDLPDTDAAGEDAQHIYAAVLDAEGIDPNSSARDQFVARGRMFGRLGDSMGYYPVRELRHASRAVPRVLRERVPLVAITTGRQPGDVERLFGVSRLDPTEYPIGLWHETTVVQPWWDEADSRLQRSIIFLYAYRLSRARDLEGREKAFLQGVTLRVCRQIGLRIQMPDGSVDASVLDREHDGIVLRDSRTIYVVSPALDFPDDPVFWRSVADLLADAIGVAGAAGDFGALLACSTSASATRLLELLSGGKADELLAQARQELDLEEEPLPVYQPPRRLPIEDTTKSTPAEDDADDHDSVENDAPAVSEQDGPARAAEFAPIDAPTAKRPGRRKLVVRGPVDINREPTRPNPVSEAVALAAVMDFEEFNGRFPLGVEHLQGSDALGCDIVSFATAESRAQTIANGAIDSSSVARFIEVKGRSTRGAAVEISANQQAAAEARGAMFFIYRVYRPKAADEPLQIATLEDPAHSPALTVKRQFVYDMRAGSGAEWYEMAEARDATDSPDLASADLP